MTEPMRVIDFGLVSPLRSQTLWHALCRGVSEGSPPTLSFTRPSGPYVCLGYHRRLEEVDLEYCRANGIEVLRRAVGGGPVYLDSDQLLFQMSLPAKLLPPLRGEALRMLMEPVVRAFRTVGVAARLDDDLEISTAGRKICGHGAGQMNEAVVFCGNLIERFDHETATRVLAAGAEQQSQTLELMRRYVAATPVDPAAFRVALSDCYADLLGTKSVPGRLTAVEEELVGGLDQKFTSERWLAGPTDRCGTGRAAHVQRRIKVRAGVWTLACDTDGLHLVASVVDGTLRRVRISGPDPRTAGERTEDELGGMPLSSLPGILASWGEAGGRLASLLASAGAVPS